MAGLKYKRLMKLFNDNSEDFNIEDWVKAINGRTINLNSFKEKNRIDILNGIFGLKNLEAFYYCFSTDIFSKSIEQEIPLDVLTNPETPHVKEKILYLIKKSHLWVSSYRIKTFNPGKYITMAFNHWINGDKNITKDLIESDFYISSFSKYYRPLVLIYAFQDLELLKYLNEKKVYEVKVADLGYIPKDPEKALPFLEYFNSLFDLSKIIEIEHTEQSENFEFSISRYINTSLPAYFIYINAHKKIIDKSLEFTKGNISLEYPELPDFGQITYDEKNLLNWLPYIKKSPNQEAYQNFTLLSLLISKLDSVRSKQHMSYSTDEAKIINQHIGDQFDSCMDYLIHSPETNWDIPVICKRFSLSEATSALHSFIIHSEYESLYKIFNNNPTIMDLYINNDSFIERLNLTMKDLNNTTKKETFSIINKDLLTALKNKAFQYLSTPYQSEDYYKLYKVLFDKTTNEQMIYENIILQDGGMLDIYFDSSKYNEDYFISSFYKDFQKLTGDVEPSIVNRLIKTFNYLLNNKTPEFNKKLSDYILLNNINEFSNYNQDCLKSFIYFKEQTYQLLVESDKLKNKKVRL